MARIKRRMAVLIVGGAFLRIAQRFVGFAKFLEFFLGGVVARIFVRVIFYGELAIGFFDAVGGFLASDFEDFVIVALCHEKFRVANYEFVAGLLATTTLAGRNKRSRNL